MIDALTYAGNLDNLADLMDHERLSFVHGDIRDSSSSPTSWRRRRDRQRRRRVARGEVDPRGRVRVRDDERRGHADPLDAIRRTPVERFVLFSSSEVYGTAEREPMDEEHPLNPRSPYAPRRRRRPPRVRTTSRTTADRDRRPFNTYGPYQHPEKLIPRFATQALCDEAITIHGDGHASRDWVFVKDVAEGVEAAIEAISIRSPARSSTSRPAVTCPSPGSPTSSSRRSASPPP